MEFGLPQVRRIASDTKRSNRDSKRSPLNIGFVSMLASLFQDIMFRLQAFRSLKIKLCVLRVIFFSSRWPPSALDPECSRFTGPFPARISRAQQS
jgi:hypothetical protein